MVSSLFHFFPDWNLFIAMPDEASVLQEDFSEWHVGSVPVHVRPGDAFVAKFLFQGRLCSFRLPCPVTIHRWKSNRRIRVRITKEVAREILARNSRDLVPLSTEWDVRIEVPCFLRNDWVPINAPESQPEPQPFVPQPTDVQVPLHPESGNVVALEPLRPPVEHLSLERPQPESQVTVPWDLEQLARHTDSQLGVNHTDSQLGVSPSSDRRPPPEEEDPPVVFSPLFQRNSNHTDSQLGVSPSSNRRPPPEEEDPPVVLAQLSQDSDKQIAPPANSLERPKKRPCVGVTAEELSVTSSHDSQAAGTTRSAIRRSLRLKNKSSVAVTAEEISVSSSHDGKPAAKDNTLAVTAEELSIAERSTAVGEVDDEEEVCCYVCAKTPCEWIEHGIPCLRDLKGRYRIEDATTNGYVIEINSGAQIPNNKMRFTFYKLFTYEKFGHLGKGMRIKIPVCVENKIRDLFPSLDGEYTNFNPE